MNARAATVNNSINTKKSAQYFPGHTISNFPSIRKIVFFYKYISKKLQSLYILERPALHWVLLFSLVAIWGSAFTATKYAVLHLDPTSLVGVRLLLAALAFLAILLMTRRSIPKSGSHWAFFFVMALLGNCIPYFLISWGQQEIDSGLAAILMAVMPVATLIFAHAFLPSERLTPRQFIGFSIAFVGVAFLIGPGSLLQLGGRPEVAIAQLAVVAGALCYAANTVIARFSPEKDALVSAACTAFVANFIFWPVMDTNTINVIPTLNLTTALCILFLGFVATGVAQIIYFALIQRAGPSFLSLINYLIPIWAVLAGFIVYGEVPTLQTLLSAIIIFTGIAISQGLLASRI